MQLQVLVEVNNHKVVILVFTIAESRRSQMCCWSKQAFVFSGVLWPRKDPLAGRRCAGMLGKVQRISTHRLRTIVSLCFSYTIFTSVRTLAVKYGHISKNFLLRVLTLKGETYKPFNVCSGGGWVVSLWFMWAQCVKINGDNECSATLSSVFILASLF